MGEGDQVSDRLLLAVLGFAVLLAISSLLVVFTLFGQMGASLRLSRADLNWLAIVSAIVGAVGTGLFPAAGSVFGQRRVLALGMGSLAAGSLLCAVAPGFWWLVVGRAVASCGGAAAIICVSVLRERYGGRSFVRSVAVLGAVEGAAAGVGFALGGVVEELSVMDWRAVFWTMAALGGASAALVLMVVPVGSRRDVRRPDALGAILLAGGLVALLLPITEGGAWGWFSIRVLGLFIGAGVLLGAWVSWELRWRDAIVQLQVLGRPGVLAGCGVAVVVGGSAGLVNITVPTFIGSPRFGGYGFGASVLDAGLAMVPFSLAITVAAVLSGRLMARVGPGTSAVAGFLAEAVGLGLLGAFDHSVLQVIVLVACFGVGHGFLLPCMYNLVARNVAVGEVGSSAGLAGVVSTISTAVATAASTALLLRRTVLAGGARLPAVSGYRAVWLLGSGLAVAGLGVAAVFGLTGVGRVPGSGQLAGRRTARRPSKGVIGFP